MVRTGWNEMSVIREPGVGRGCENDSEALFCLFWSFMGEAG